MSVAIEAASVSKNYRLFKERNQSLKTVLLRRRRAVYDEFWALRDVSLQIPTGSTFGIIGENGSGKSTLLKCMARILLPDEGAISVNGRLAALLELGSGFHPELSGRENVYLNGSILGMSRRELDRRFDEIVDFSGVERFIDQPVKTYSSGMYVRLGFSVAISVEPEILLVDEVLAVGDVAFQEKCMDKFKRFREEGRTVVIVTHAMGSVREMCDHAAWLDGGTLHSVGTPDDLVDGYLESVHAPSAATAANVIGLRAEGVANGETIVGGPLVVHVTLERTGSPAQVDLVLSLVDHAGRTVWSLDPDSRPPALPEGRDSSTLQIRFDSLPLVPGSYSLRAAAVETGAPIPAPDRRLASAQLVVTGPAPGVDGVLALEPRWVSS